MINLLFVVKGDPIPKGSFKAFKAKHSNMIVVKNASAKTKGWQKTIGLAATLAMQGEPPSPGPIAINMHFAMAGPPKSAKHRRWPTVRPDLDKLCRTVLDALTGIVFVDDAQVIRLLASERYTHLVEPHARIFIQELKNNE